MAEPAALPCPLPRRRRRRCLGRGVLPIPRLTDRRDHRDDLRRSLIAGGDDLAATGGHRCQPRLALVPNARNTFGRLDDDPDEAGLRRGRRYAVAAEAGALLLCVRYENLGAMSVRVRATPCRRSARFRRATSTSVSRVAPYSATSVHCGTRHQVAVGMSTATSLCRCARPLSRVANCPLRLRTS